MITDNRWKHILGVARKAKYFASKFKPDNQNFKDILNLQISKFLNYTI